LQGPKNIGKSTVILETLGLLSAAAPPPLSLGGFFTWNNGKADPRVYMRPAGAKGGCGAILLARWDFEAGRLACDIRGFEEDGVRILESSKGADLIIMDELGFLESSADKFKRAVFDALAGEAPVLGALRLGDVPWHRDIKRSPGVALFDVSEENRNALPQELARLLAKKNGAPATGCATAHDYD